MKTAVESEGACPDGWHLPSDAEWKELEMHLGMSQEEADNEGWRGTDEGNKLKESGNTHWYSSTGATNSSGFTALPGGSYDLTLEGPFNYIRFHALFWTATEYPSDRAWYRLLSHGYSKQSA